MNRREFIRTAIATSAIMAVAVTGVFEMASKAVSNQAGGSQQTQLQPSSAQSSSQQSASLSIAQSASQPGLSQASSTSQTSSSASPPAGYVLAAQLSSLAGMTSAYFTHPTYGRSILLNMGGQWRAFSATCTHLPCTVEFVSSELYCPCHGATFSATNGSVTRGPARASLDEFGVIEQGGGVYVSESLIN
jgi:cytochrome b6-f complex iron-sulfur subunit